MKDVSQITLEMLHNLNVLSKEKDRLVEIIVDGAIEEDEISDFKQILETLEHISIAIDSLKMWVQHEIASGKIKEN